jgi:hypothetical protein
MYTLYVNVIFWYCCADISSEELVSSMIVVNCTIGALAPYATTNESFDLDTNIKNTNQHSRNCCCEVHHVVGDVNT